MVQIHSPRPFVWFAMPWFVYVLRSEKDGKRYFGCTQDLTRRLARHLIKDRFGAPGTVARSPCYTWRSLIMETGRCGRCCRPTGSCWSPPGRWFPRNEDPLVESSFAASSGVQAA